MSGARFVYAGADGESADRPPPIVLVNTAPASGRFFPAYVLFFAVVHTIVGARPLLFFALDVVVLAAITAALIGLVRAPAVISAKAISRRSEPRTSSAEGRS